MLSASQRGTRFAKAIYRGLLKQIALKADRKASFAPVATEWSPMKYVMIAVVMVTGMVLGACESTTLEKIVEERHQQRIEAAHANAPLTKGANDGLGSAIAETGGSGMTLSDGPRKNQ